MLGGFQRGFKLLPDGVGEEFTHGCFGHPKFPSRLAKIVHIIIREHYLTHRLARTQPQIRAKFPRHALTERLGILL